jgi:uncharacterized protein YbjT (DUF2867 family)
MSRSKTIAVAGATGQQGGAVAAALINRGIRVRALTRNPQSDRAEWLRSNSAEVVGANFDDPSSLEAAFRGVDGAFLMGTPFEAGEEAETRQGIQAIDALKKAGVPYVIYTSAAGADDKTGIPHFDSKYRVEEYLKKSGLNYTIIAPVFFYQNILVSWLLPVLKQGNFAQALPADRPLQLVSTESIGSFAAYAFSNGKELIGKRVELAGDELSGRQIAEALSEASGKAIGYFEVPLEQVRAQSEDSAKMYDWFNRVGYSVDIDALRRDFGEVSWLNFREWAKQQDWGVLS